METNLLKLDEKIKKHWKENDIPKKTIKSRKGAKRFFFLDGPPYASGDIHVGTALNKILKDYYIRYYRMKGFDVWCQPGYDCHGLPIENKVEKKLGLKFKQDIEKYGVEKFIKECHKYATEYIGIMNDEFNDLGTWMDWENPYLTLTNDYIEGAWHTFKAAHDKDLLYKGVYPVHVCSHCATAVAYNEIAYKNVEDTSIYVKFPVKGKEKEYLVIWTTTPWTLPANTGVMVNPKFEYAKVSTGGETWIIAKDLVKPLFDKLERHFEIVEAVPGKNLEGTQYTNPLHDILPLQKEVNPRVIMSEQFVTLDAGTGLVHTAPGHGLEDYKAGRENKLQVLSPVTLEGKFTEEVGAYCGRYVKDCDDSIIAELEQRDALVLKEKIQHEYPHCWRCDTPLLFISVPQWFFRVSKFKNKLLHENKKVKWTPDWAGKRFDNWLETLDDWPISRQRYWGIPLPIWVCEKCEKIKVVGSYDELPKKLKDYHKPYIDEVTLKCSCGGEMRRVPDVLDVWFDSGVCSWASLGYPREKELFKELWPADFILEGSDQIRGWWNSQAICSTIAFDQFPFESVLFHGFVLDAHGESKMSKSKGGLSTREFFTKYPRDSLRHYFLSVDTSLDFAFELTKVDEANKYFGLLTNIINFFNTYCEKVTKLENEQIEDRWLLSRLNSLIKKVQDYNDDHRSHKALEEIQSFVVNDLSKSYIKFIRERTRAAYEGKDKKAAFYTLYTALDNLVRLMAPAYPHIAEEIYLTAINGKDTVHMTDWPEIDKKSIDEELEKQMDIALKIIESAASLRNQIGVNLRQPLRELYILSEDKAVEEVIKKLKHVISSQANVKDLAFGKVTEGDFAEIEVDKMKIFLNKHIDPMLAKEGMTREVIRRVQQMRKEIGLKEKDKITMNLAGPSEFSIMLNQEEIKKATNAKDLKVSEKKVMKGHEKSWEINGQKFEIVIER
jgi:isoleucyl-tRNA synthetase